MRRRELVADSPIASILTRESFILFSTVLLVLIAVVTTAGTLIVPVSGLLFGRRITVGPAFYNNVLIAAGLPILATMAAAPLIRWGSLPSASQVNALKVAACLAIFGGMVSFAVGLRSPIAVAVTTLVSFVACVLVACFILDVRRFVEFNPIRASLRTLNTHRRQYSGFLVHIGFACIAVGIAGSSLGTQRNEVMLDEGQTIEWAGRSIRYEVLVQRELPDKLVAESVLRVTPATGRSYTLRPARHLHLLQNEWTTEVAIHSTWAGDFYTILNSGEGEGRSA